MPTYTTTLPIKPKARKQLNELQTELLQILYKFRFGNVKLISQYQDQTIRNSNVRLKNLLEQDYIGRFYTSIDRINRRPATYFLLPKAIRLLAAQHPADSKGLHLLYYNRSVKPAFVGHWLRLFRLYLKLDELYSNDLEFYSATELADQQQFKKAKPDVFLSFSGKHADMPDCMFDLIESNISSERIRQRVSRYIYHQQITTHWSSTSYPCILLLCDNLGLERDVRRMVARTMDYASATKPVYFTTTLKALFGLRSTATPIWSSTQDSDTLLSFDALSINH
jgi:hypothetical protein